MNYKTMVAREIIKHGDCLTIDDLDCECCPFNAKCNGCSCSLEVAKSHLSKKEKPMKVKSTNGTEIELTEKVLIELADIMIERGVLKEEKPKYPYVGVHVDGDITVLFTRKDMGVRVSGSYKPEEIGLFRNDWIEVLFKPVTGTITYKNGKPIVTEVSK